MEGAEQGGLKEMRWATGLPGGPVKGRTSKKHLGWMGDALGRAYSRDSKEQS